MNESALADSKEEKASKFQSTPLTHIKNELPHSPVLCLVVFMSTLTHSYSELMPQHSAQRCFEGSRTWGLVG